jgi:hypothetical protein
VIERYLDSLAFFVKFSDVCKGSDELKVNLSPFKISQATGMRSPQFLPDGRHFVYYMIGTG